MPTKVVMPQMGESIAEGTITKWLKKVGERVERDEPLLEISTDKVDAEIPSPASGVLTEILAAENQTLKGTGVAGRIGKRAVLDYVAQGKAGSAPAPAAPVAAPPASPTQTITFTGP